MKKTNTHVFAAFASLIMAFPVGQTALNAQESCTVTVQNVQSYTPGKRKDGSLIPAEFANSINCIGAPQNNDAPGTAINYVSLGFGGEIVVRLTGRIADGSGADFRIVETTLTTTNCSRIPERVEVFGSQDGCNFVCLGSLCQDGNVDLAGSGIDWVEYVKLHDISPLAHPFQGDLLANGYDFDGIQCLSGAASASAPLNTTLMAMYPRTFLNYLPANPTTIPLSRRNPQLATGAPQNNNGTPITFTSLGFGGEITLVFDYIVFDKQGPDLQVVETSGSTNYPEKAEFYGSSCGNEWVLLNITQDGNVLEQDGWIDFGGMLYGLKYLRIIDRSKRSQFSGAADGYDVDGVVVINGTNCSAGSNTALGRFEDEFSMVPDEAGRAEVFPNPFNGITQLTYTGGSKAEEMLFTLSSITGQVVSVEALQVGEGESITRQIDLSNFGTGIYLLEVRGAFGREVYKLINN